MEEQTNTKDKSVQPPTKKLKKLKEKIEKLECKAELKKRLNNVKVDLEACKNNGIKNALKLMREDTISYFNWVRDNNIRLAKAERRFVKMEDEYMDLSEDQVIEQQPQQPVNNGFDIMRDCQLPTSIGLNF